MKNLEVGLAIARADLNRRLEKMTMLVNTVREIFEQFETMRANATRIMANMQTIFG